MSKKFKLAHRNSSTTVQPTNWEICALCQQGGGILISPTTKGYETLAGNLSSLQELNRVPLNMNISRLDEGDGVESTLVRQKAKWHKACYVLCNASKVERARKQVKKNEANSPVKHHLRSAADPSSEMDTTLQHKSACFFCDDPSGQLHKVETMDIDLHVRQKSTAMRDSKLLAKLSAGDMVATDSVYHKNCLTAFYNRHRSHQRLLSEDAGKENVESLAFAEVVSHIEDCAQVTDVNHVFKLTDLTALYCERLQNLGADPHGRVHSTRLAQRLQQYIPNLEIHPSKSGTVLSFKKDTGDALLGACQTNPDEYAIMLMRVAKLIRKEIFQKEYHFNTTLCDKQYDDLPAHLSALVRMILQGFNMTQSVEEQEMSAAASSITQLLVFNAVKRGQKEPKTVRHNLDREPVLPLYLGLLIHSKTRKRDLVDALFQKGLSVSYDRVLQVSADEANRVISMYEQDGIVCPTVLKYDLFTTGNLDNIDHNLSSTLSHDSFHGTALSITQHVTNENPGIPRAPVVIPQSEEQSKYKYVRFLPQSYMNVPPILLPENVRPTPPTTDCQLIPTINLLDDDLSQQNWLDHVRAAILNETQTDQSKNNISWSSYFAALQESVPKPPAIITLLPMFRDGAHSPAMVKHGMDVIKKVTDRVNPGQIPVLTVDQPLYALAKKIQWTWPNTYGEKQYVVMMGGLHIEMAMLSVLGSWFEGSGWSQVMTSANVTTEGRALGLQKGSHTSRSQWAHQVTVAALWRLLNRSYAEYCNSTPDEELINRDDWCQQMLTDHPQFHFWYTALKLELLFLQFLRSQREQLYTLYVESLASIIPWMFALDHYHYARWMAVHIRDLLELEHNSPTTKAQFISGNFVTQKTSHKFSALAHDQVHEQLNAMVKGDGGIIGITENEAALTRWMVAGPETARLLTEYEEKYSKNSSDSDRHHEQIPSTQKKFLAQVKNVTDVIEELGNPFAETTSDLYTLDGKVVMLENVVTTVRTAEQVGKAQYHKFVQERLKGDSTSFNDSIQKNSMPLFSCNSEKKTRKVGPKIVNLQNDVRLFSRLYISCQSREGDMDAFFAHENHPWPPSLASNGVMHQTTKSDLILNLESLAAQPTAPPHVDAKVVDGSALVHILDPKKSTFTVKTFKDYADFMFLPHLRHMLEDVVRLDVVWDIYRQDSLKAQTRQTRGSDGYQLQVDNRTKIPSNWQNFLRVNANKSGLFQLLATAIEEFECPQGKQIISTLGENAVSSPMSNLSALHCTHEEADTRLLFHASHSFHHGLSKIMIHATDTDVVVLAIAASNSLPNCELWVAFGHGSKTRYIPCHLIAASLGTDASIGLLMMHALSGCDTVSAFFGIGKRTAWSVWCSMPDLQPIFARLSQAPSEISSTDMDAIQRYVVLLYQRTSMLSQVNDARKQLFASGNRKIENIPPTFHALEQHVKRAVYQAGHIWGQTLIGEPELPSPELWGWTRPNEESQWLPRWTTLSEAAKGCQELLKCGCKKSCTSRCKCTKAGLSCTQLCFCSGQCHRE